MSPRGSSARCALLASLALAACTETASPRAAPDAGDVPDVAEVVPADAAKPAAEDVPAPAPDAPAPPSVGRACEGNFVFPPGQGDCEDGQVCLPPQFGFNRGYCSSDCGSARCPAGSACVQVTAALRYCFASCRSDADCRRGDGYRCQARAGAASVCTPADAPLGTREGEACYTTAAGPHQLPGLRRETFSAANISLSQERDDARLQAEGNVVVSPVNGAVAVGYIAVDAREAFMGVSTRFADGSVQRAGAVRDPSLSTTSDPVLAYTADGRLHMVFLGFNRNAQGQPTGMRLRHTTSADDGRSWATPRALEPDGFCAGTCDKPWIVVGPTPAALQGGAGPDGGGGTSLYVGFMVQPTTRQGVELHVLRSDDGGARWTAPQRITTAVGTGGAVVSPNLLTPAVGADGALHVVYAGLSTAGGAAGRFGDARNRVYYRASRDGGATWSAAVTISRGTDTPVYGQPVVAIDGGRLHAAYVSGTQGAWDVMLATSGDGGASWTHRKVNDDPERCATHTFPWIVADPARARVHALWLENRFGEGAAAYAACPSDPAMPCGRNEQISDEAFTFETSRDPGRWHGDYQGLTLGPDGTLWAAWSDTRSGTPAMYLARGLAR